MQTGTSGQAVNGKTKKDSSAPEVTVVLSVYNDVEILAVTLKLLREQDFSGHWELIVCDDGSDVNTFGVLKDVFTQQHPPVRYIWQSRNGERRAHSRNNGLRCASGEIIILLDSDIAVAPDFISRHVSEHKARGTVVYGSRRWLFLADIVGDASLESIIRHLLSFPRCGTKLYSEAHHQEKYANSRFEWLGCMASNFSFRRNSDTVLFDEAFVGWGWEDVEFAYRLREHHGYKLKFQESLWGVHMNRGTRSGSSSVRTVTPSQVAQLVQNLLHFRGLYPNLDVVPTYNILGFYILDHSTVTWNLARRPNFEPQHIELLLRQAEEWHNTMPG
jgi:glycosyltransferase involved in cell wall biosynthesis